MLILEKKGRRLIYWAHLWSILLMLQHLKYNNTYMHQCNDNTISQAYISISNIYSLFKKTYRIIPLQWFMKSTVATYFNNVMLYTSTIIKHKNWTEMHRKMFLWVMEYVTCIAHL